jgi:phosphatidate cytidylyltransferase
VALNKEVFKTRALTAVIFAVVMLGGLLWNMWSFLLLVSVIHFGCWFEYLKITEVTYKTEIDIVIKYFFAIVGFTLFLVLGAKGIGGDIWGVYFGVEISYKVLLWLIMFVCLLIFIFQNKQISNAAKKMMMLGFVYISIPLALFLHVRLFMFLNIELVNGNLPEGELPDILEGKLIPCTIIFSIWINDTMQYIVGSLIGKTPFSKISPKKTWEGTIGGAVLCVVVIGLLGYFLPVAQTLAVKHWVAIAAICAVFGTLGDLLESKIKRLAGVKDSGSFMPGHGGFLDRFDSLLVAAPFVWLYVQVFVV